MGTLLSTLPMRTLYVAVVTWQMLTAWLPAHVWLVSAYLLASLLVFRGAWRAAGAIWIVLTLQAAAYLVILELNPLEAPVVLDRLLLQLTPSTVLLLAMALVPFRSALEPAGLLLTQPGPESRVEG